MAATISTTIQRNKQRAEELAFACGSSAENRNSQAEAVSVANQLKRDVRDAKIKEDAVKQAAKHPVQRAFDRFMVLVNGMFVQTVLYLTFVIIIQSMTSTVRIREEFFVDKHVMDRIVENHFDSSHNTFESIRRTADIWEWGNTVLWPGLFGDAGPCTGTVGSHLIPKTCVDEAWPDGEGSFHGDNPTPYDINSLVERMDQFDWSEGITIRQGRVGPKDCPNTNQLGECLPDLKVGGGSQASYGYNWTSPNEPPLHPFVYFDEEELGSNPDGVQSAAIPSMMPFDATGFLAVAIPFFSDTYLAHEEGPAAEVTDYRLSYVNTTNGRVARYYCVRVSTNGLHVKQLCDPGSNGDGTGSMTGVVRATVERMWNDLKRGHFIDMRTRVVTITLQLKSNHIGVRYRQTLMFELTSLGAVLTSYDVESRPLNKALEADLGFYADIALALVIFFCLMEGYEVYNAGVTSYFSDVWNVMDWLNFIVYFCVYGYVQACYAAIAETPEYTPCTSYLCREVGYFDDWKVMITFKQTKLCLSLCVCIQLFKILKIAALLVPKMGLATAILKQCVMDLFFFGITFIISMLAFSMMLFVQLGPMMESYIDQIPAFIALFRALFGDFDIDEILNNSSGYLNCLLFLGYLFVAIFIMLSMFLAILAEAQVAVREHEQEWKDKRDPTKAEYDPAEWAGQWADEYGVVTAGSAWVKGNLVKPMLDAVIGDDAAHAEPPAPTPPMADEAPTPASASPRSSSTGPKLEQLDRLLDHQQRMMDELLAVRAELAGLREKQSVVTVALANGLVEQQQQQQQPPPSGQRQLEMRPAPMALPAPPAEPPRYVYVQSESSPRFPQAPYPPPPPPPYPPPARQQLVLSDQTPQPPRYAV